MAKRRRRQESAQKRKQDRIQKTIVFGSIAGVVILAAAFVYFVLLDTTAPIPDDVLTKYEGIPQSLTNEGYGVLGNPNASVEVVEFSSFACPHCKDLQPEIEDLLRPIQNGYVRLTFVPIYNIAGEGADEGGRAAICAGQQGKFFEMHDVMFHWQGSTGFGNRNMRSAAEQLDLNVDAFMNCYDSSQTEDLLVGAERFFRTEMARLSTTIATPRVTVNGVLTDNVVSSVTDLVPADAFTAPASEDTVEEDADDTSDDAATNGEDTGDTTDEEESETGDTGALLPENLAQDSRRFVRPEAAQLRISFAQSSASLS